MCKIKICFWKHEDLNVDNYDNEQDFEVDMDFFARIPVVGEMIICNYEEKKILLTVVEVCHKIAKEKNECVIEIACREI